MKSPQNDKAGPDPHLHERRALVAALLLLILTDPPKWDRTDWAISILLAIFFLSAMAWGIREAVLFPFGPEGPGSQEVSP